MKYFSILFLIFFQFYQGQINNSSDFIIEELKHSNKTIEINNRAFNTLINNRSKNDKNYMPTAERAEKAESYCEELCSSIDFLYNKNELLYTNEMFTDEAHSFFMKQFDLINSWNSLSPISVNTNSRVKYKFDDITIDDFTSMFKNISIEEQKILLLSLKNSYLIRLMETYLSSTTLTMLENGTK